MRQMTGYTNYTGTEVQYQSMECGT